MLINPLLFMLAMYKEALLSRQVAAFFLNLLLYFDAIPIEVSLLSMLCGPGSAKNYARRAFELLSFV